MQDASCLIITFYHFMQVIIYDEFFSKSAFLHGFTVMKLYFNSLKTLFKILGGIDKTFRLDSKSLRRD